MIEDAIFRAPDSEQRPGCDCDCEDIEALIEAEGEYDACGDNGGIVWCEEHKDWVLFKFSDHHPLLQSRRVFLALREMFL